MKELYDKLSGLQDAICALTGAFGGSGHDSESKDNEPILNNIHESELTPADLAVTDRTRAWRRLLVGKALMALSRLSGILKHIHEHLTQTATPEPAAPLAAPATPHHKVAATGTDKQR